MPRRIHPRQIDAFRAVMMAGSVSAAASYMHVTQPAVSRLLRDLEADLGFPLFDRAGGRLVPRKAAAMLFREVERVYVGLDQILRVAQDIRALSEGVLRIGTVSSFNDVCTRDVLPELARRFPNLTIAFDTESTERVLDLVSLRHYDIGLVCSPHAQQGLIDQQIFTAHAVAAIPLHHAMARKPKVALADLAKQRVILPGRTSPLRLALEKEIAAAGLQLRSPIEASLSNCCRLAARGLGIAIVDPLAATDFAAEIRVRPLVPRIPVAYRAISARQTPGSLVLESFLSLLNSVVTTRLAALHHE
jgi:DNA-binding transcriptional LysR family regulator